MKLLLDAHTLVWSMLGTSRLSANARAAIEAVEAEVRVSIASVREMAIKFGLSKWPEAQSVPA